MSDTKQREYAAEMGDCFFNEVLEIMRTKNFIEAETEPNPGEMQFSGEVPDFIKALYTFLESCEARKCNALRQFQQETDPRTANSWYNVRIMIDIQKKSIEELLQAELKCLHGTLRHYELRRGWVVVGSF